MAQNKGIPIVVGFLVVLVSTSLAFVQARESIARRAQMASKASVLNTAKVPTTSATPSASVPGLAVTSAPVTAPAQPAAPTKSVTTFTLAQVALHDTASDCWTTVNGGVYDLTSWIARHPGGQDAILSLCGHDGSAAFNAQHDGQSKPENMLASFRKGDLIK